MLHGPQVLASVAMVYYHQPHKYHPLHSNPMRIAVFLLGTQLSIAPLLGAVPSDSPATSEASSGAAANLPQPSSPPAKSAASTNPQSDLNTAVRDIGRRLRDGDLPGYRNTYATPEALKQMQPMRFWNGNFTQAEQQFERNPIMIDNPELKQQALQTLQQQRQVGDQEAKAWEALAGQPPTYNQTGDEATFTKAKMSSQPPWVWNEKETVVFVKINGLWYLKNVIMPNLTLARSRPPAATKPVAADNPQKDLKTAIPDIARLIKRGDFPNYTRTYLAPDKLKQMPASSIGHSLEQMVQDPALAKTSQFSDFLQQMHQILDGEAKAWEALESQTPAYNQAGDEATFTKAKLSASPPYAWSEKETVVFVKINGLWYLKDLPMPNMNQIEKIH